MVEQLAEQLQVNEAGVGVPTSNLPVPPIPGGVVFHAAIKTTNHTNQIRSAAPAVASRVDLDSFFAALAADTLRRKNWLAL
jgi:hypothetical protein